MEKKPTRDTAAPRRDSHRSPRDMARDTSAPLPVLGICNSLLTGTNYLSAVESAQLPTVITSNPENQALVTAYTDWQETVWQQFFESLLDAGVMAQAQEIHNLVHLEVKEQSAFQSVVNPSGGPVPTVIALCDDMADQITSGNAYVTQLIAIARQIKGVDEAKIDQLDQVVSRLNSQFDSEEQELTNEAIDSGKDIVVSVITVGVSIATEEDPIAPLIEGVAQVASDIVKELLLSSEINQTLLDLESAWSALDQATLQLAQVNLILNRLKVVVSDTSSTMRALNRIVDDWQTICDVIRGPADTWKSTGLRQITEWAARMTRVKFAGSFSQTVS